jgi:NADPH:quinone reductase-like Zn-dependent oxidoreductase
MGVELTRPKARVAGIDAAGVVEAAGANVRGPASGDDVLDFFRARSRSTRAPQRTWWCPGPAGLTFEQGPRFPSRRRRRCAGSATRAR